MGKVKKEPEAKEEEATNEAEAPEDPPVVKELKELDDKYLALDREYEEEVGKLIAKFAEKQQPLLSERKKILAAGSEDGPKTGTPALASFWLKAMQNHPSFGESELLQEYDEPVLEYLQDVTKVPTDVNRNKGFKLTFYFAENPYFTNMTLEKEYTTEETNPYCGEISVKEIKCDTIDWKEGKDVTVEKVAKKVKGGGAKKAKQKKEKLEARPSFFRDFFRNLKPGCELPDDAKMQAQSMAESDEDDEDDEGLIEFLMDNDHDLGEALSDQIIPFAVRWYTGEAVPEGYDDDDDEEGESEDDDDDDDESSDEPPARGRSGRGKGAKKIESKAGEEPKEECKQQ